MNKMASLLISLLSITCSISADEGMWPLNMVPKEQINKRYGLDLDDKFLDHLQKSCLRMSTGGSASFISPNGLLITNHHVALKMLYNLSSDTRDIVREGYCASIDLPCPSLYVDQLIAIQDVTEAINQAVNCAMTVEEKEKVRKEAIALLTKKVQAETNLQPQVVALYHGARYHLYLYKRYTDVRLVMAPEQSIAFFGGNEENFEYPRHCLDVCFFRVYENNKPLVTKDYLSWSKQGPKAQEPLFVLGHPGKTDRKLTSSHLAFMRDVKIPLILQLIEEKASCLTQFGEQSSEHRRISAQDLYALRNAEKVYRATYEALKSGSVIEAKKIFERDLFAEVNPKPWLVLEAKLQEAKKYYLEYSLFEGMASRYCKLYAYAKHLVRLADEKAKPSEKRYAEYIDSELASLEQQLLANEPLYKNLEQAVLINSFKRVVNSLPADHPAVALILQGESVESRAQKLVADTKLGDASYRKTLYENLYEVKNSQDPMIQLARALDPISRHVRAKYEQELESVENESYAQIMQSIFARYGDSIYPDATFTLRLSVGTMQGYVENQKNLEPFTALGGVYAHAQAKNAGDRYRLPTTWLEKEGKVDKQVPFNFVSTHDIIGGNSGSPVINKDGELVGVVFDGNAHTFFWNYEFNDVQARAVSVHSEAIIEVLKSIYNAHALVQEIISTN